MSKDFDKERAVEEKIAIVDQWISSLAELGKVGEIDPTILMAVLEECGADFADREGIKSLSEYTNKAKASAMRLVWGEEKFEEYKGWARKQVEAYETQTGLALPALGESGSKTSGMIQFFGELTALAASEMSLADFTLYTEARIFNGRKWQEGKKDERITVKVPTAKEPIRLSSIPPDFPLRAWAKIKTFRK